MSTASPTGTQVHLQLGEVSAQIAQVGASLRSLRIGSVDLIAPYPEGAPTPSCSGVVLVPWPNRVRDGRWNDDGTARQLAITEPKFGNASHGLLRFTAYEITEGASAATLRAWVVPQTGYPYLLETSVTYTLRADCIDVEHVITNHSAAAAPVAVGSHPFLTIGDVAEEDLVLRVSAATAIETDDRMLPVGARAIDPAVRDGVRLGDVSLDTGFIDLDRDADGLARHSLTAPDGRRLTLWQGDGYEVVQVFTTDKYPGRPLAVAMEPMTAPADAFNSGTGLRRLAPGETWTLRWGITLD
ncbi:galactose mutarotase [Microbacterium sp. SZ1]|uniref:aldose 1-epimerase family protein n=1 Tax=Microbacterium sp. SZ1 TaxID=1849736 RepID=UPI000BBC8026|nr:aldose 1-epimerase family protein [Microbacterium sp. SZ1]PCE13443.1 galactose mutarotase [Microbacterium sp. SZ1]